MIYIDWHKNINLIQLSIKVMGMRKILAHDIRMPKNLQTKEDSFSILADFHGVMRVQSPTCNAQRKFHQWCR